MRVQCIALALGESGAINVDLALSYACRPQPRRGRRAARDGSLHFATGSWVLFWRDMHTRFSRGP